MFAFGIHDSALRNSKGSTRWNICRITKNSKEPNYGMTVERYFEDDQRHMCGRIRNDLRRFFCGTALLQRPIQGRKTMPRRRQRHRKDRNTPKNVSNLYSESGNMTRQSSEADAEPWSSLSSTRALHCGLLRHHKHGDHHNNLPYLVSQQSC